MDDFYDAQVKVLKKKCIFAKYKKTQ